MFPSIVVSTISTNFHFRNMYKDSFFKKIFYQIVGENTLPKKVKVHIEKYYS